MDRIQTKKLLKWEKYNNITTPHTVEDLKTYKEKIKEIILYNKEKESLLKISIKNQKFQLKQDIKLLNKITTRRLNYEKTLKKIPIRFSARINRHRKWAKEHPIEAFNKILDGEIKC